ncbi:MAG TPA: class I SAM-dependent methyltransferase [Elusimicrobiota bacterium]|nr:class I SAM-dependent methyltransferase [Elusimicrobiota bacterium]
MEDPRSVGEIVPEYRSRNPAVRWLFTERLRVALELGALEGEALDVLDLGCGEGAFLSLTRERYPRHRYAGWDVHPDLANVRIPGVELAVVNVLGSAPLPARRFDRVFCLDVLEHFKELSVPLARIRGLLKPGGLLVLSEPTESWLYKAGRLVVKGTLSAHEGPAAGPHYHDAAGVHREVLRAGFECTAVRPIPPRPFDLFHLTRYKAGKASGKPPSTPLP